MSKFNNVVNYCNKAKEYNKKALDEYVEVLKGLNEYMKPILSKYDNYAELDWYWDDDDPVSPLDCEVSFAMTKEVCLNKAYYNNPDDTKLNIQLEDYISDTFFYIYGIPDSEIDDVAKTIVDYLELSENDYSMEYF